MSFQVPQEIIDKILDHVASDSGVTSSNLQECVLVCRSFRPRSQHHMFSSISIGGLAEDRKKRIQGLQRIIQENPDIVQHIQELNLECSRTPDERSVSWIYEDRTFVNIMKSISTPGTPLRKLTLWAKIWTVEDMDGCMENSYDPLDLKDEQKLVDAFIVPYIVPYITSMTLRGIANIPIEVVTLCININDLELSSADFHVTKAGPTQTAEFQPLKPQYIAHRLSRDALSKLLQPPPSVSKPTLNLSQLKSLTICTDELSDLVFEQKIIDMTHRSLEDLRIITMDTSENHKFHGSVDLQHSSRLRSLKAHVCFPEDSLVSLRRTLSSIRPHSLESLYIEAKVAFNYRNSEPEVVFDGDWDDLCFQVARVMFFGESSRVEIKVTTQYWVNKGFSLKDWTTMMDTRCQSIMETLGREKLHLLQDNTDFTFTLSYELEYDSTWYFEHMD